ncbi:hypothetical protein OS493_025487 [Desmophyllum pertusum]|uniref:Sulfatase N-terminal domain-containing protein n=1 Tax=Desmophyllum pertusum TaxID=174260 RepID=A0A9X0CLA8_9CNID|nr:hypothetical protein OS493_025487 [Desmophyllum pertusum]
MKSTKLKFWLPYLLGILTSICKATTNNQPHIIFILADDLGWDDVGFHGSKQIPTPNIDEMANEGVILNNYYVSPMCTPTRASIMSGKHPIHLGIQHFVIFAAQPYGLPLKEVTTAQYLKALGYQTHAIGKWHLGYFSEEYTPLKRGFDSFFGFLGAKEDYWDHSSFEDYWGYDLRDNKRPIRRDGIYATDLFTQEAIKKINAHDVSTPMFMYLAHQAAHSANQKDPLQAPEHLIKKFSFIKDKRRQKYAAMVTSLDESVGAVKKALADKGMLHDSVIIFTTDNGGAPYGFNWRNFEAIRKGNFKLVVGMDDTYELGWHSRYPTSNPPPWEKNPTLPGAEIKCGQWTNGKGMCDSKDHKACLFNLADDPCEYKDVSHLHPQVVLELKERLNYYRSTALPVVYPMISPDADPDHFKGSEHSFWGPWKTLNDKSEYLASKNACNQVQAKQVHLGLHPMTYSNRTL